MRNKAPDQTITPRQVNQPKRGRARQNTMKMSQAAEKFYPFPLRGAAMVSPTEIKSGEKQIRRQELLGDLTTSALNRMENMYAPWMFIVSPLRYKRLCLNREAILNCMK